MKITVEDSYTDEEFTLDMVGDWAIYARAKDAMLENGDRDETTAICWAVQEEDSDFRLNMKRIREWRFNVLDAIRINDDSTFEIEDDFYTDEHMVEIAKALKEALYEAEYDTYEAEKEWTWYHR